VQLPVGILIHVTPPGLSFGLVLARTSYFVAALSAIPFVFRPVTRRNQERAA
jgi:hypothetical protein